MRGEICYRFVVLPGLNEDGELPPGLHLVSWPEFASYFCRHSPRRLWLSSRLRAMMDLAAASGKFRRVFVWGSFVTAKLAPGDIDVLLIMDDDFEVEKVDWCCCDSY